jgi:hypothetical protein
MLPRTIFAVATGMLLAACVDSERLRSGLGGHVTASEVHQGRGSQSLASKELGALERLTVFKPSGLHEMP